MSIKSKSAICHYPKDSQENWQKNALGALYAK